MDIMWADVLPPPELTHFLTGIKLQHNENPVVHIMQQGSAAVTNASAPEIRGRRMGLSRAARRGVRQAAQLANELNLHSFRIHVDGTVTWVRWREDPPPQVQQESTCNGTANPKTGELSRRARKSNERERAHRELHEMMRRQRASAALQLYAGGAILHHWQRVRAKRPRRA